MSQKTDRWKTRKAGSFMFTYAVLSEVGEREINEDSVGFAPVGKDIGGKMPLHLLPQLQKKCSVIIITKKTV